MTDRPKVAMLMPSATRARVLAPADADRLASFADVAMFEDRELTGDGLPELLDGAVAAITGWKSPPLPAAALEEASALRFVAHAAGSVRFLDVADAVAAGRLRVSHSAAMIAQPVAEFTVAQMLMHLRHIVEFDAGMRAREPWFQLRDKQLGQMLCDQTVGLVGAGYVGRLVIDLLRAFKPRVLVYDPYLTDEGAEALGVTRASLEELFAACDIVSLHAPVIPETRHMITGEHLAQLRDGALLINTARAAIIDEAVLLDHLRTGRFTAAIDVFETEPLPDDSPLRDLPNVRLAPHASGHSAGSYLRQGRTAVEEVHRFVTGAPLQHEVTKEKLALMA
ncbi:hydroxyacid dehydrogenase [Bauldia sp.]|uniref:hydroxyacid dehydrogenase n=1 Tax=Bauldia sp. TaxID=2575872 RepID=UPI003BAB0648